MKQKNQRDKKRAVKKKDRSTVVLAVLVAVLAVGLVVTGAVFAVKAIRRAYLDSGRAYRGDVILSTEHHSVNAAMFSFHFYDVFYNEGLHTGYDDPDQLRSAESPYAGLSLYDYDVNILLTDLDRHLHYAESATAKGKTLDEYDEQVIANRLNAIRLAAQNSGSELEEYMFARYGRGVRLSDAEDLMRIRLLAEKEWNDLEASVTVSEEEISQRCESADPDELLRFDYYIVDLDRTDPEDRSASAEYDRLVAKEHAAQLVNASSPEEFRALALTFMKEAYRDDPDVTDDNLSEIFDADCRFVGRMLRQTDGTDPDATKWLFSKERVTGDALLGEDGATVYYIERGVYSIDLPGYAFRIISVPFEDYPSRSEALDVFNGLVDRFEKTDRSEDSFIALLEEYEHKSAALSRKGYYDDVFSSSPFNTLLSSLEERLDASGSGFEEGKTYELYGSSGVYLLYCLGLGETRSRVEAREALITEKCSGAYAAIRNSIEVRYNEKEGDRVAPRYVEA